jgi:hypothetical protein
MSREAALILALGALAVAALFVSIASWVLLWAARHERRAVGRTQGPDPAEKPVGSP